MFYFNTIIKFDVGKAGFVKLELFNIKGQKIKTLYGQQFEKGQFNANWNGKDSNNNSVSSGVYFYKYELDNKFVDSKKILLIK